MSAARPPTGLLGEGVEQRLLSWVGRLGFLWMPLNRHHPSFGSLDGFDKAISRPGHGDQGFGQRVDPLVMGRRRIDGGLATGFVEAARFGHLDIVHASPVTAGHAVLVDPGEVREVLVQRPPERDVHHLKSPANAEDGNSRSVGLEKQIDLEGLALLLDPIDLRVPPLAKPGRVHVPTADQHQAVEGLQYL